MTQILLVEDNPDLAFGLRNNLEIEGYKVDLAEDGSDIPVTMRRLGLRGTPSSLLIGRDGAILHQVFGVEDDIAVGARIAMALAAPLPASASRGTNNAACADGTCTAGVAPETAQVPT